MTGATKPVYAPEPFDVGRILQAEVISDGQMITVTTTAPIDPGLLLILKLKRSRCNLHMQYSVFVLLLHFPE